jgi:hypothetical protein
LTPPRLATATRAAAVGDLWRVVRVDEEPPPGQWRGVTLERVQAEPGTYRSRGDGLWPPLPEAPPISDEEARAISARMDGAMDAMGKCLAHEAPFLPADEVVPALDAALARGWARPVTP